MFFGFNIYPVWSFSRISSFCLYEYWNIAVLQATICCTIISCSPFMGMFTCDLTVHCLCSRKLECLKELENQSCFENVCCEASVTSGQIVNNVRSFRRCSSLQNVLCLWRMGNGVWFHKLFLYFWRKDDADNYDATNDTVRWNLLLNNFEQNCSWHTTPMFAIDRLTPRTWKFSGSNTKADHPDRFFHGFSQCLHANFRIRSQVTPRPLSFTRSQFVLWGTDSRSL